MEISGKGRKFVSMLLMMTMLLILLNIAPATSFACSCVAPWSVQEELEHSAAVFKGSVIGVVDAKENSAMQSSADPIAFIIKVDEIWKGINQTEVVVYTERDSASCGFTFEEGQEYLIYASKPDDHLRVSLCSRTTDLASAAADLSILGKGAEPTEQIRLADHRYSCSLSVGIGCARCLLRVPFQKIINSFFLREGSFSHSLCTQRLNLMNYLS